MAPVCQRVCVIGTGYVGAATAVGLAALGHDVRGYDLIKERITGLASGMPPYHEESLSARLREQLASSRLTFVHDLALAVKQAQFIIVCVGTPSCADGSADLSALKTALAAVSRVAGAGATVVIRSTVPCGTTDLVADGLRASNPVLYAPEFLREGHALEDFLNPDRIVVGSQSYADAATYVSLFASLRRPVVITTYRNAELIKAFSNAFLAMKVSFANEVANFCDEVDADALAVLQGVGADRRIGSTFLAPGIGFGGPCFEKDLKSLQSQARIAMLESELVDATLRVNDRQPLRIVDKLAMELGTLRDSNVAVWGLTFKAGTDDVRDSLAVKVIDELNRRGARVVAYDPAIANVHPMVMCEMRRSALDALKDADALVVLTEWPMFADVAPSEIAARLRRGVVVDGRNVLDGARLRDHGVRYVGVGRRFVGATDDIGARAAAVG